VATSKKLTDRGGRIVSFSPTQEARFGPFGATRLVQSPNGGDPVPYYETVRPSPEVIASLRASVGSYRSTCLPLVDGSVLTNDQVLEMVRYAINAQHESSPEMEFSHTAGDVGNDLLQFVQIAKRVLNSQDLM
jgi:hypothetical protein